MAFKDKNGEYYLLAGNTRLMSFTASGKKLPIKVIDYDGEFRYNESVIKEHLLLEGGAYGHLNHPFDDKNLTFSDFKTLIINTLQGKLDSEGAVTEKNRHIRRLKNPDNLRRAYLVTFMLSVRSMFFGVVENDLRAANSSSVKRTIRFGGRAPMIW